LPIGEPHDQFEQEADAVAERVLQQPAAGYDFGGVRVHTGARAAAAARRLGAQAFTVGRHIVFGRVSIRRGRPLGSGS
jgi:Domain of unknown function (DUF4157)